MLNWKVSDIANWLSAKLSGPEDLSIHTILIDSRSSAPDSNTLFVALKGPNHDGHNYIHELIERGVKVFLVQQEVPNKPSGISILTVENTLSALQSLALVNRESFTGKVMAITGSNGKTIVKEWLASVLSGNMTISKSPKSYNSQVGVALSLLQSNPQADLHIIEAGISMPGEMDKLARMIMPDYGLITNIGDAHQENFTSIEQKLQEKLKLFKSCKKIFYPNQHELVLKLLKETFPDSPPDLIVCRPVRGVINTKLQDKASLENISQVMAVASFFDLKLDDISSRIADLEPLAMRMEQKRGINGCTLINDYYNSDFQSIQNAVDLLWQQTPQQKKTLIISDVLQSGEPEDKLIEKLNQLLADREFTRIFGIGRTMQKFGHKNKMLTQTFPSTDSFLERIDELEFKDEAILLKGARIFQFERISALLEEKVHRTILRINMPTLRNNLNIYRNLIKPGTRIMGMVKASSYGSGSHEIARFLAHQNIDYLTVAFLDEGIDLRKAGVKTPIMVMNPDFTQLPSLIKYGLEPEVFSFSALKTLFKFLKIHGVKRFPIHIKLDTGMHRLGFSLGEIDEMLPFLHDESIRLVSLFSHLAAASDPDQDEFTLSQIKKFTQGVEMIKAVVKYPFLRHVLNTSGIERFPEAEFEMVRLGIGLYGFGSKNIEDLESPIVFQSYISQIHHLDENETIGYDRLGKLNGKGSIGIIPVGYADGFDRRLGNGNWKIKLDDSFSAKTVGQVCMDMCMIDLTGTNAREGDIVTIVEGKSGIEKMAMILNTIPYEILTGFSSRITRVYEFD
jgi:alanine racemase